MSDVNELAKRIDAALSGVKEKAQQQTQQRLQEYQQRQELLKEWVLPCKNFILRPK